MILVKTDAARKMNGETPACVLKEEEEEAVEAEAGDWIACSLVNNSLNSSVRSVIVCCEGGSSSRYLYDPPNH